MTHTWFPVVFMLVTAQKWTALRDWKKKILSTIHYMTNKWGETFSPPLCMHSFGLDILNLFFNFISNTIEIHLTTGRKQPKKVVSRKELVEVKLLVNYVASFFQSKSVCKLLSLASSCLKSCPLVPLSYRTVNIFQWEHGQ